MFISRGWSESERKWLLKGLNRSYTCVNVVHGRPGDDIVCLHPKWRLFPWMRGKKGGKWKRGKRLFSGWTTVLGEEKSKPDENTAAISSVVVFVVVVVVVFELYRYFAPTTWSAHPVSVLMTHPREIQILWSHIVIKKTKMFSRTSQGSRQI